MTRRDWLKLTTAAGGAVLLPNVTGLLGGASAAQNAAAGRERLLADFGWRFHLGHADDLAKDFGYGRGGAFAKSGSLIGGGGRGRASVTQAAFDDGAWTAVDLPHDWAVDLPFNEDRGLNEHGAKPLGRAFPDTSIGWYRRTFDIPASDAGRRIAIEFDGVFRDCIVILNGHYVGRNLSGYSAFRFDVTDLLTYGGKNALVVRVDATEYEGWFYEGAGIYRHVWLEKTAPLHVAHWGTFVRSASAAGTGTVSIATEVQNDANAAASCRVVSKIVDAAGATVATLTSAPVSIPEWGRQTVTQTTSLARPHLWSLEDPHLYKVLTSIVVNTGPVDTYETPFGIRNVHFDAETGFSLNGKPVKIKGTCNHQDHAGVGAGLPDRLQYFRIEKLKEMGSNAYRTSHNPPTPELLDACDRLGMLVLDETRMMDANEEGLSQFERLIRRDRNHPSVFCWSIGNEEPEQGTERGARVAATMKRLARELDPTRLVTEAMNNAWGRGLSAVVDVQGFNYRGGAAAADFGKALDDYHRAHPTQPTMGTEVASTVSTRGIYANDEARGYVSAYDRNFPPWASTAEEWWTIYNSRPWVGGGFVWTGFDYRGEPTPYNWPCISSHFGIIDICGFPKDLFYYYQAWWSGKPVLHLFPHWNWNGKEGQDVEVWCFTNADHVELIVNGTSAGEQEVKANSHVMWKVPYVAGAIEARGRKTGVPELIDRRETTGAPAKIVLVPDRTRISADGEDLSVVVAQIVDSQGRVVPTASDEVTFTVSGPGRVIGVGNGDPSCHEPDRASKRKAFSGLCMALVQTQKTPGEIRVDASAPGLSSATATLTASATTPRPTL
ncbi:MAG TPA: beta-galactosidase GalA [Vicinamibacterales bacterium]|nr:beta-galactosidase GalA [Vicinamibacterales bacterium]